MKRHDITSLFKSLSFVITHFQMIVLGNRFSIFNYSYDMIIRYNIHSKYVRLIRTLIQERGAMNESYYKTKWCVSEIQLC